MRMRKSRSRDYVCEEIFRKQLSSFFNIYHNFVYTKKQQQHIINDDMFVMSSLRGCATKAYMIHDVLLLDVVKVSNHSYIFDCFDAVIPTLWPLSGDDVLAYPS